MPNSRRILYRAEPGTQVVNGATVGHVAYNLSAAGYTDAEFLHLADSLQPV